MYWKKIGLFAIVIAAVLLASSIKTGKLAGVAEGIKYTGIMCYEVERTDGIVEGDCRHNTYTEFGQNVTRDALTTGGDVKYISVGNGTGGAAIQTSLDNEINECGVNAKDSGSVSVQEASVGNFSVQVQYSITCAVPLVNTTGIFNASTGNTMFAVDNFTSAVTNLQSGDTLTVTWYIWST